MTLEFLLHHLSIIMFFVLIAGMFLGFPVALTLGGIGVIFGLIGWQWNRRVLAQMRPVAVANEARPPATAS